MTEFSAPWPGRTPASAGDAGPYTATHWWNRWGPMHRSSSPRVTSNFDNVGVLYVSAGRHDVWVVNTAYIVGDIVIPSGSGFNTPANLFYVCTVAGTSHAAVQPNWPTRFGGTVVDSTVTWTCFGGGLDARAVTFNSFVVYVGSALVDGTVYSSDAVEPIVVASATAGNVRDDRLVLRKSYSTAVQTVRLTLLAGSEIAAPGPGTPPTLTQDTDRLTYWDIPLFRVSVTDAGVITLTDEREFVDAEYKTCMIAALAGYNHTDVNSIVFYGPTAGVRLIDAKSSSAFGSHIVNEDFIANMDLQALAVPAATGNIRLSLNSISWAKCGQNAGTYSSGYAGANPIAITGPNYNCIALIECDAIDVGDIGVVTFTRDGAHVDDTIGDTVAVTGWLLEYFGWR